MCVCNMNVISQWVFRDMLRKRDGCCLSYFDLEMKVNGHDLQKAYIHLPSGLYVIMKELPPWVSAENLNQVSVLFIIARRIQNVSIVEEMPMSSGHLYTLIYFSCIEPSLYIIK